MTQVTKQEIQDCITAAHKAGLQNSEQLCLLSIVRRFPQLCAWYADSERENHKLRQQIKERNNLDASLTAAISSSNARHFESMEHEAKSKQLERELNEVTKQRNALTEALIAAQGALNPLSGFTKIKGNRYLQIVRDKVREALETTKGEKP